MTAASLHTVGHGCRVPLLDGNGERSPFSRGGHTQIAGFGAFSKTPPTVEPVEENLSPRGGYTHTEPFFGAVKVVVRPGASSSVLTPRGTFVQKAPNCWRNEELVDT